MREQRIRDHHGVAGHEVDDARRQARLLEQAIDVVGAEHGARRRLPDDGAAHQRRRRRQVAADGGEVERRDRVDESLEAAIVELVPHRVVGDRLLAVQLLRVGGVVAPEVDQLARRIDLGLKHRLRLAQHRRRIQRRPPRRGQQLGGLEEDRRAILPRPCGPVVPRGERRVDGLLDSACRAWCVSARTCRCSCGITACVVRPVRISRPPMMIGMSMRSSAIDASRALISLALARPDGVRLRAVR